MCTNASSALIYKFPPGSIVKETQIQEKIYPLYKYLENNSNVDDYLLQIYSCGQNASKFFPSSLVIAPPQKQTAGSVVLLRTFMAT